MDTTNRIDRRTCGLLLLGLVSVSDVATSALSDGEHPPYTLAALGCVVGLTFVLVVRALRDANRGLRLQVAGRIASAVSAMRAF